MEETTLIGRGAVWVPDPFDWRRSALGERRAQELDERARIDAVIVAALDDAELERVTAFLGWPLDELDPARAAASLDWLDRVDAAYEDYFRATERLRLLEGVTNVSTSADLNDELDEAYLRAWHASEFAVKRGKAMVEAGGLYLDAWIEDRKESLSMSIAASREGAIREQEHTERAHASRSTTPMPPRAERQQIPGDVSIFLERRRAAEARTRNDCRVEPRAVPTGWAVDLGAIIGVEQAERLKTRMEPLVTWLQDEEPWLVRSRGAELGPVPEGLGLADRLKIQRLKALENASTSERQTEVQQLTSKVNAWGEQDNVVLTLAYAAAVEFHRLRDIEQRVELSLREPTPEIEALVGPRPDAHETEPMASWRDIVRRHERDRIGAISARENGVRLEPMDSQAREQLDHDIDQLRAERGLPQRESAALDLRRGSADLSID